MSVSFQCHCRERKKKPGERNWRVVARKGNRSAFNGYRWQPSDYSEVVCLSCGVMGRTKAQYVDEIEDVAEGEFHYIHLNTNPEDVKMTHEYRGRLSHG